MSAQRFIVTVLAATMSTLVCSVGAHAQNILSAVASTGNDINDCTVPTPCRTFARALAVTNAGGEIVALDSDNFSPATITNPVTIVATGVRAAVFRGTAHPGFTINTTGNVAIKGISFNGLGIGTFGIDVVNVGTLYLDNVEVQGFATGGVDFAGGSHLVVSNSVFRDCGNNGLTVTAGSAYVRGSSFLHNGATGLVVASPGSAVVVDSVASHNASDGFTAFSGTLRLVRDEDVFNNTGIFVDVVATANFEYSLVSDNTSSPFIVEAGGTLSGSSPGTSLIVGSGTGTLSASTLK